MPNLLWKQSFIYLICILILSITLSAQGINSGGETTIFYTDPINETSTLIEKINNSILVELSSNKLGLKTLGEERIYNDVEWAGEINGEYIIEVPKEHLEIHSTTPPISIEEELRGYIQSISQKIEELDEYEVEIYFNEDTVLKLLLDNLSVDWGDGKRSYVEENKTHHIYRTPGVYHITIYFKDCFGIQHTLLVNYTVNYEGHLYHTYLFLKEYKEPVVAITSTSFIIAILVALSETLKFRFFTLLTVPLSFYRIQREDVLDNFVRGEIYSLIKTNPGIHYNEIMRRLNLKNGTLSYHLYTLEKMEMIKSRVESFRYRAFYPTGARFPEEEKLRLTEIQSRIIKIIREKPGITQREIADKIGRKPQTINYNIKVLEKNGLIKIIKRGRKTICLPAKINTP